MTGPARQVAADDPAALDLAVTALLADRLVALPTETVYGLACALTGLAVDRLVAAKGRDPGKGLTLLVDGLADAEALIAGSPAASRLAARLWPGPLTLVVPLAPGVALPWAVTGGTTAVGLRVPDQPFTRRLARAMGPLPLTSANRSGEPDALDVAAVQAAVGGHLELVVDGGRSPGGVPSTVVALATDGSWRILRPGPVTEADLTLALRP
ncbi:MAG TPA: L-threonylcarbamoyladenylate synthase [Candidatus Sulfotelmatobacter sp.]|nr:L-threonylcarbamoyladenylate synthase [Candidatus Sulfotelmatobacter sp.]